VFLAGNKEQILLLDIIVFQQNKFEKYQIRVLIMYALWEGLPGVWKTQIANSAQPRIVNSE